MSTPRNAPRSDERSVTRTYRAAIRLGEDFITLEETVTLPIDASEEDVQKAVGLGWRIYEAQREAVERQVAAVREAQPGPAPITVRDPDAPASDKQRNYVAALQDDLGWSSDQLATYAAEQGVDLVTMTKGQASVFIDGLKRVAEERPRYDGRREAAPAGRPANDKQLQALQRLADTRGVSLEAEATRRYGAAPAALSFEQAAELLGEWQGRAARANGRG